MTSMLSDIMFSDRYMMDDCSLNMYINYENLDKPELDIYIEGDLIGEIQNGSKLKFRSKL